MGGEGCWTWVVKKGTLVRHVGGQAHVFCCKIKVAAIAATVSRVALVGRFISTSQMTKTMLKQTGV